MLEEALKSLKGALVDATLSAHGGQRTPLRRLTRLEYSYTIEDLLFLDAAAALELAQALPAEAASGGFDTLAAHQGISPLHVRAYLATADQALDAALALGPRPETVRFKADYARSQYLHFIATTKGLGRGIVKQLDDAYVAYFAFGAEYTFHSASEGFRVPIPGRYRVSFAAYPYQAKTPVVLTVYRGRMAGLAASLDELIGSFDLTGGSTRTVEMTPYLHRATSSAPRWPSSTAIPTALVSAILSKVTT